MRRLFDFLFPPRVDEIALRDISVETFLEKVAPRLAVETRPEAVTLLPFHDISVRAAIHEAKYHGSVRAFDLLATALVEYLRDADDGFGKPRIVPIPLGRTRRRDRGFNQMEEITKRAATELAIAVDTNLLIRTRETVSQVSLPRHEREENMRGAFKATGPADPASTYIVIDDVLTTGATLQAAVDALTSAGATQVVPLALAH